jgi:ligand-binding sensor domain-containing protein
MVAKDKIIWRINLHLPLPLLFLLLVSSGLVNAQPPIAFKNYTTLEGLSHNIVRKTIMDTEGFIWVATQDGLNKFNGHSFEIYKVIPDDSTSISSNKIITLAEDKYHNIWIGTWG